MSFIEETRTVIREPVSEQQTVVVELGPGVQSWKGRIGAVVPLTGDYTAAEVGADPTGSATAALGTAETFATAAVATETTRAEAAEALLAPQASPTFTGTVTVPDAVNPTDAAQLSDVTDVVAVETTRAEGVEALLAPLASPAFTGAPTGLTATPLTDDTQLATTAYADAATAVEKARAQGAESTNASAIAAETVRAEAAEALAVPKAGGTMTGALIGPSLRDHSTRSFARAYFR